MDPRWAEFRRPTCDPVEEFIYIAGPKVVMKI